MYLTHDWEYLLAAFEAGGSCQVSNHAHRAALQRLGLMEPCRPGPRLFRSGVAMALTKAGQRRAADIAQQQHAERTKWRHKDRGWAGRPLLITGKPGRVARSTIARGDRHRITGIWRETA